MYHCLAQLRGFSADCILRIQRLDRLLPHAGHPRRYHTCPEASSHDEGDGTECQQRHGRHHLPSSIFHELVYRLIPSAIDVEEPVFKVYGTC